MGWGLLAFLDEAVQQNLRNYTLYGTLLPTFLFSQPSNGVGLYDGGLFNLLISPELLSVVEDQFPEHRERHYPPTLT